MPPCSILTAAEALKDLVDGFDIDPSKWLSDDWNLPESGNGVPDLLDEMQWELDWMMRMQDTDGGVYHKLTSCNWFFGMPHEETTPRLINPKVRRLLSTPRPVAHTVHAPPCLRSLSC